jgi:hypothetical protein
MVVVHLPGRQFMLCGTAPPVNAERVVEPNAVNSNAAAMILMIFDMDIAP